MPTARQMANSIGMEAKLIEVEAIRRAALNIEAFIDDNARPAQILRVRLALAKRYDDLVYKYGLDTSGLLTDRITEEFGK